MEQAIRYLTDISKWWVATGVMDGFNPTDVLENYTYEKNGHFGLKKKEKFKLQVRICLVKRT